MLTNRAPLDVNVACAVADFFALGVVDSAPVPVAAGWAEHNIVWRFETSAGPWAVKQIGRDPVLRIEAAAQIEAAAHAAGIACPRPRPGEEGRWALPAGGAMFRCHEWIDGQQPTSSLTQTDALQAGELLGRLHSLDLPWQQVSMTVPNVWGEQHWRTLTERATTLGLTWAIKLRRVAERILTTEDHARAWADRPHRWVGSHRDVRPDNTLRVAGRILLLDWDSAGPVVPGREVATALRWWAPHEQSFVAGYREVAGDVNLEEGAGENGGLLRWLELNVRLALDEPHHYRRQHAVEALLDDLYPDARGV